MSTLLNKVAWCSVLCLSSLWNAKLHAQEIGDGGSIIPATPIAFEGLHLELPQLLFNGSCWAFTYAPELHRVERSADGLSVHVQTASINIGVPPPGCPSRTWVRLGNLPQGTYTATLFIDESETPTAKYEFTVTDPGVGNEKAPAFNYSGFFWDPLESGSSLQVIQTGKESLGAVLLTYDDDGAQQWIVIGAGGWETPGRYVGKAWKTRNGHPIGSAPPVEPTQAEGELIGDATIDFGGGIGTDPNSASVTVTANGELLYQRDYQRFAF